MTNLVIADHDNAGIKAATLSAVTAAQQIGGDIHILVAGHNCAGPIDGSESVKIREKLRIRPKACDQS